MPRLVPTVKIHTLPDGACDDCGGAGWFVAQVPFGDPQFGKLIACRCTRARQEARSLAAAQERLTAMCDEMGELAGKTLDSFDATWPKHHRERQSLHAAVCAVAAFAADPKGRWLFLTGPYGSGKSHLAAAAALQLAGDGYAVFYRSVPAMLEALRAGYRTGDFDARLAAICDVSILVLDDLGAEAPTPNNRGLLFTIVNHRAMRPDLVTIVTSNVGLVPGRALDPELTDLDPRIASRLRMRSVVVSVLAGDYREQLAKLMSA